MAALAIRALEVQVARVAPAKTPQSESAWAPLDAALVEATASAFGAQWTEFALDAARLFRAVDA